jgi:hypothetical protein
LIVGVGLGVGLIVGVGLGVGLIVGVGLGVGLIVGVGLGIGECVGAGVEVGTEPPNAPKARKAASARPIMTSAAAAIARTGGR